MNKQKKIRNFFEVAEISQRFQNKKLKIGLCHGVFDLLHPGHFAHLKAAKKDVDVLFVSVTSDRFVNKGPKRPLFSEKVRAETISLLECVDYVFVSDHATAVDSIKAIKPDVFFKGSDYRKTSNDLTGMIVTEIAHVEKFGGIVEYTNEITSSSTSLINNYFSNFDEEQSIWLDNFQKKYSLNEINKYLNLIQKTNVNILGEIIIDKYTECEPLTKSSKDPILAFQVKDSETFFGGVLAIRENIKTWVNKTSSFSCLPMFVNSELKPLLDSLLSLDNLFTIRDNGKLIIKHRFVDKVSKTRVFETYDYEEISIGSSIESFRRIIDRYNQQADLWVIADYGHGLISKELASFISTMNNFIAVNTQANAGNRGYNTITKYKKIDFLSLNGGELQLELRERNPDYINIVPKYMSKLKSQYAILTMGAKGLIVFSRKNYTTVPAFGTKIVDKVGAGDSVLAIGSILARHKAPIEIIGLISSVVAAHEISQLGHRTSLKLSDIQKAIKALLG